MFFALVTGNDAVTWLVAAGTGLFCYLCLRLILSLVNRKLKQFDVAASANWEAMLSTTLSATHLLTLVYFSVYVASLGLTQQPRLEDLLRHVLAIVVVVQIGLWGNRAIRWWMEQRRNTLEARGDNASLSSLNVFKVTAQIVLWVTILLLLLDNLGFNISTLVTSLGIGGVAIALAVQNILGDLFASLSIAMDKPFVVGDSIQVDDFSGTVKRIGLKTTRVQSFSGEELVFSNGDLLRSRLHNFQHIAERQILFTFGVTYDTKADQIEKINTIVRQAIESQPKTRFKRVHFKQFDNSSLTFEVVYSMLDQDYLVYMDTQQSINIAMLSQFSAAGIAFAFPTQTLNIASLPPRNLLPNQPAGNR
jgi:small-conductance mechanosensitive channel